MKRGHAEIHDRQHVVLLRFGQPQIGELLDLLRILVRKIVGFGAVHLYVDFINIFLFLLRIFGSRR